MKCKTCEDKVNWFAKLIYGGNCGYCDSAEHEVLRAEDEVLYLKYRNKVNSKKKYFRKK